MTESLHRYTFADWVDLDDVEDTLLLAKLAAEGIHGQAEVKLQAAYSLDKRRRTCDVDGSSAVGTTIARVLTGLLTRGLGENGFAVDANVEAEGA